ASTQSGSGTYSLNTLNPPSYNPHIMSFEQIGNPIHDSGALAPRWVKAGSLTTGTPKPPSQGTLVRWTLEDVKFAEGGTATGSFIYDASTGTVSDFDFHFDGPLNGFPYRDVNQSYPCQPNNTFAPAGGRCWNWNRLVARGLYFENGATSPAGSAF